MGEYTLENLLTHGYGYCLFVVVYCVLLLYSCCLFFVAIVVVVYCLLLLLLFIVVVVYFRCFFSLQRHGKGVITWPNKTVYVVSSHYLCDLIG